MGRGLELVVERLEHGLRTRPPGDPERDQAVGEPGVLRQEGAVEVGADHVCLLDALAAVTAVVPMTVEDSAERLGFRAEVGATAVVLEPGEHPWALSEVDLDRDVADQSRPRITHGFEVRDPETGDRSVAELVAMAEQLIAAADCEQGGAIVGGRGDCVALGPEHVLGHQDLVAILAAADVDQVVFGWIEPLAGARCGVGEVDTPPLAAALEEDDVAPVRVDVHLIGIEGEQAEPRGAHAGTSIRTTVESASSGPELIWRLPAECSPASSASSSRRSGLTRWRRSSWTVRSMLPSGETRSRRRRMVSTSSPTWTQSGSLEYTQPSSSRMSGRIRVAAAPELSRVVS